MEHFHPSRSVRDALTASLERFWPFSNAQDSAFFPFSSASASPEEMPSEHALLPQKMLRDRATLFLQQVFLQEQESTDVLFQSYLWRTSMEKYGMDSFGVNTDWQLMSQHLQGVFARLSQLDQRWTVEDLLSSLESEQSLHRQCSLVFFLGELHAVEALPVLSALVLQEQRPWHMRCLALWALTKIDGRKAASECGPLLQDRSARMRCAVIWVFGQLRISQVEDALMAALSDHDPFVRDMAVWALGRIGSVAAIPRLLQMLQGPHRDIRWTTANTLKLLPVPLDPLLARASNLHEEREMRILATHILSAHVHERVTQLMVTLLHDASLPIQHTAITYLGRLGEARFLDPIFSVLENDQADLENREQAIWALGNIGGPLVTERLLTFVTPGHVDLLNALVQALGALGGPEVRTAIPVLLTHQEKSLRLAAIRLAASLHNQRVTEWFFSFLNDKERESALRAKILYLLSDQPVPSSVFSYALQDEQPDVCIAAIRALMQRKEYGSVPELLTIVATSTIPLQVRRTALEAVGCLGTKAHTQQVMPYLNETNLRLIAVQAMGQLRDPAATEALLSLIRKLLPTFEQHEDARHSSSRCSLLRASIESLGKIDALEDILIFKELWLWAGRAPLSPGDRTDIQWAIIHALERLSNQEATSFLMTLHQEASPDLRADIIFALAYRGASISLPLLVEALWDENADIGSRLAKMWQVMKIPLIRQILQEKNFYKKRD